MLLGNGTCRSSEPLVFLPPPSSRVLAFPTRREPFVLLEGNLLTPAELSWRFAAIQVQSVLQLVSAPREGHGELGESLLRVHPTCVRVLGEDRRCRQQCLLGTCMHGSPESPWAQTHQPRGIRPLLPLAASMMISLRQMGPAAPCLELLLAQHTRARLRAQREGFAV